MPTFRTLFSGGELFGVGARAAGWAHVDGVEIRADIAAVAQRNGFDVRAADVCDVDYASLPAADHLHASPSCKNASQAKTDGGETEEDRAAAAAICRAIRAHQGRSFSLENVWNYRTFEGFARIVATLQACGFVVDHHHINAADFGVPQTRKRLILRAVRCSWRSRVPPLHPTHRKGGDMFHTPWVGWYAAIEDILDTLPPSQFAPWQLARLPKSIGESFVCCGLHGGSRAMHEPAATVMSDSGSGTIALRAFIVGGDNTQDARWSDGPMLTIANDSALRSRALLVGGQYARNNDDPDRRVQTADAASPSRTVTPGSAKDTRAFLVSPAMSQHAGGVITRQADEPSTTIVASTMDRQLVRAWLARGRVVKMTAQALGRFQTVPDDYQGLTAEINGNGVPCLLVQRIMESLL